jgi:hypothetical protein
VTFDLDREEPTRGRGASTGKRSSRLCLVLKDVQAANGVRASWQDEDQARLESQLTEVVVGIAVAAEHIRQQLAAQIAASERKRLEGEERRLERKEEDAVQGRSAPSESARIETLRVDAALWHEAERIRAYVAAVQVGRSGIDPARLREWAHWALAQADSLDPLLSGRACDTLADGKKSGRRRSASD